MPMRKNEGPGPQVTIRFANSSVRFPISAGETVGGLAGRLACLSEVRAKPLSIDLTFPRAAKPVLH
jgi:hypothetical protein